MIPKDKLKELAPDMQDIAQIAATTGVSVFKQAFRDKSFNRKPWPKAKARKDKRSTIGSLMIKSAALMNSIREAEITPQRVVWTAGGDKVPYAEVHNKGLKAGRGKGFIMPQREYMGESKDFDEQFKKRCDGYFKKKSE